MNNTENVIREKSLTEDLFHEAHDALVREASFRTSRYRSTDIYRQKMSLVLLNDTVRFAFELVTTKGD